MAEIAEMMINGLICNLCGVFLDGDEPGYPRMCKACESFENNCREDLAPAPEVKK